MSRPPEDDEVIDLTTDAEPVRPRNFQPAHTQPPRQQQRPREIIDLDGFDGSFFGIPRDDGTEVEHLFTRTRSGPPPSDTHQVLELIDPSTPQQQQQHPPALNPPWGPDSLYRFFRNNLLSNRRVLQSGQQRRTGHFPAAWALHIGRPGPDTEIHGHGRRNNGGGGGGGSGGGDGGLMDDFGPVPHGFRPPTNMDFEAAAFRIERDWPPPPVVAAPVYNAPPPAREGFTRTLKDDSVPICPNCEKELGVGDTEMERQVWVIKSCGHVYCGSCTKNRHKRSAKATRPAGVKPFAKCVIDGCGKTKVSGPKSMFQIYT